MGAFWFFCRHVLGADPQGGLRWWWLSSSSRPPDEPAECLQLAGPGPSPDSSLQTAGDSNLNSPGGPTAPAQLLCREAEDAGAPGQSELVAEFQSAASARILCVAVCPVREVGLCWAQAPPQQRLLQAIIPACHPAIARRVCPPDKEPQSNLSRGHSVALNSGGQPVPQRSVAAPSLHAWPATASCIWPLHADAGVRRSTGKCVPFQLHGAQPAFGAPEVSSQSGCSTAALGRSVECTRRLCCRQPGLHCPWGT